MAVWLGKSQSDIKVNLHHPRKRNRKILDHVLSQTASYPSEIKSEIRYLASSVF
jgi:L-rhamnose isomerase